MRWNVREKRNPPVIVLPEALLEAVPPVIALPAALREAVPPAIALPAAAPREAVLREAVPPAIALPAVVLREAALPAVVLREAALPVIVLPAAVMMTMMTAALPAAPREAVPLRETVRPQEARLAMRLLPLLPVLQDRFPMYMAATA